MKNDIPNLFHRALLEIPTGDKRVIEKYWKEFEKTPIVKIDDEMFKILKAPLAATCVTGANCLHVFYFREFAQRAPLDILLSLIKHELAHCFDFATHPKHYESRFRPLPAVGLSRIDRALNHINEASFLIARTNLNEVLAVRQNQKWGSDEKALDLWIYEAMQK